MGEHNRAADQEGELYDSGDYFDMSQEAMPHRFRRRGIALFHLKVLHTAPAIFLTPLYITAGRGVLSRKL